jgi:hypothetical protein
MTSTVPPHVFSAVTPGLKLAGIDWHRAGDQFDKVGADLRAGGCEGGEDLESLGTGLGLVTTGYFASDDRGTQLAFGQIIGGVEAVVLQEGEEMVTLLKEAVAHGFFIGLLTWCGQQCIGLDSQLLALVEELLRREGGFFFAEGKSSF